MKNKKTILFLIFLFVGVSFFSLFPTKVSHALAITLSPRSSDTSTSVDYCVGWSSSGFNTTDDGLIIVFEEDESDATKSFDTSAVAISDTEADTEVYFYIGSSDCTTGGRAGESLGSGDKADRDIVLAFDYANDGYLGFLIDVENDETIPDSTALSIGFTAKAGNTIVTPQVAGNYKVLVEQYVSGTDPIEIDWFDAELAYIGGLNEVDISADVASVLSFSLSDNNCDLGTFYADKLSTCFYTATVSTNATAGYILYIREDGEFIHTNATDTIAEVGGADNEITAAETTKEEYGVSTSLSGQTIAENDTGYTCGELDAQGTVAGNTSMPGTALSTTDKAFASYSPGPIANHQTTLCHASSIIGTTEAGSYSHTVTITIVGNF